VRSLLPSQILGSYLQLCVCYVLVVGGKLRHSDVIKYVAVVLGGLLFTIATVVIVTCVAVKRHKLSPGRSCIRRKLFIGVTFWCFHLIPELIWYLCPVSNVSSVRLTAFMFHAV